MARLIFSSLPMFVSGFWAILLLCTQIEKYNPSRLVLSLFMVVTALMFYAHCVFFNEMHSEIPVSDTFYSLACWQVIPYSTYSWFRSLPPVSICADRGCCCSLQCF